MKPCYYCGAPDKGIHKALLVSLTEQGSICPECIWSDFGDGSRDICRCSRCHRFYDAGTTISVNECPACEGEPLELIEPGVCDADFYKEP